MDKVSLAFLLVILASSQAFAMGDGEEFEVEARRLDSEEGSDSNPTEESANLDDFLNQLLEHELIAPLAQDCREKIAAKRIEDHLGNCIWNHQDMTAEMRGQIGQALYKREPKANERKYESIGLAPGNKESRDSAPKDPALAKLSEFYTQKLNDALYGENKGKRIGNNIQVVDHQDFYALYKSQIGKNMINGMSSYCIETTDSLRTGNLDKWRFLIDPKKVEDDRKKNVSELSKPLPDGSGGQTVRGAAKWNLCITHLQFVCQDLYPNRDESSGEIESTVDADGKRKFKRYCDNAGDKSKCDDLLKSSQGRACEVVELMKQSRQALMAIDKIDARFDAFRAGTAGSSLQTDCDAGIENQNGKPCVGVTQFQARGENSFNNLTTLSSQEVVEASGFREAQEEQVDRFSGCYNKETGVIQDSEICKEFLNMNKAQLDEQIAEYKLREEALYVKMKTDFNNPDNVRRYLAEEGYSDEKIEELMSVDDGEYIREIILQKFERRKGKIHEELLKKIGRNSIEADEVTDNDAVTLAEIGNEMEARTDRLRQLIHYNNIVSGYLEIQSEDGESKRNIGSINKEFEGIEQIEDESLREQRTQSHQAILETGVLDGSGDADESEDESEDAMLKTDQINELLLDHKREPGEE